MGRKLLLLILLVSYTALSQDFEPERLFSQEIGKNIKKYKRQSQQAYADKDYERAEFLFDSLIKHVVNGSHMDNFKVRKLSGRLIEMNKFEKPVFLMTYASWCTPGVGEIPALNEIAETHHKDIDFVVLYWDSKSRVRKAAREYGSKINVVYVDEMENKNSHIIEKMKHSLGFPTSFFMDGDKKIVDVRRGVLHPYNKEYTQSYDLNYNSFMNGISLLINLSGDQKAGFVIKKPTP